MAIEDDPENPPQPDENSPATDSPPPPPPPSSGWTVDKIKDWMRAHGVAESIIAQEANDSLLRYGDQLESVLNSSLPNWLARGKGGAGGGTGGGGSDWWSQNGPAAPADYTAGTYTPPTFNEPFVAPTAESLLTDPGYIAGRDATQQGLERSAAARGSVLSGGFVGKALPRALTEYAGKAYESAFGRAFDTYQQKYGMFSDAAARSADAFKTNETGKLNQYMTRYNAYRDIVNSRRQAELDRWQREMDLARLGQGSTGAPPSA